MSTVPPPVKRHALGLPQGSVRSILALLVVALLCGVMLLPTRNGRNDPIPPYLIYLLFLILGHFFAALGARHSQAGQPWPLHLPPGLVRLLIIAALVGTIGWKLYSDPDSFKTRWEASIEEIKNQWNLPLLLLGGFFAGIVLRTIVGRENPPPLVQDIEAWVALFAVVCLFIAGIIHLVINPSLENQLHLRNWEGFLAVVVAFYFGARS